MPRKGSPYGSQYERDRARLLAYGPRCHRCGGPGADSADHVPALAKHRHVHGSGCCVLYAAHLKCNMDAGRRLGWQAANARRRAGSPAKGTRSWRAG